MRLALISAMYENGGNTLHRHLDGHPELLVYPFESQLGTRFTSDELQSTFPFKYRWPVFPLENESASDFELFFDEELKTRLRRRDGSKFRDANLDLTEKDRKAEFIRIMTGEPRSTGKLVMAFFEATFAAWKNLRRSGREKWFLGYSPIIGVDADRVLADLPDAVLIHVIRHPLAAYAETKRRPFPLSCSRYTWIWEIVQRKSLAFRDKYPSRYVIVRYEDLIRKKKETLEGLCKSLDIEYNEALSVPSWNGIPLENQYPWGTIGIPDNQEQADRINELSQEERAEIDLITRRTAQEFEYEL
jgi:hypothetical protein